MSIQTSVARLAGQIQTQADLIGQVKDAIAENVNKTNNEVNEQTALIQQIKAALEGKAIEGGTGGGSDSGYDGDLYIQGTATATPASGVSQVSFNNIPKEPDFFVCYVDAFDINTYHRAGVIAYDGEKVYGQEYYTDGDCYYHENTNDASDYYWKYTYSGTTLTIASSSNSKGGYFHNPGTYTLWYAYKDNENGTVAIEKVSTQISEANQTITFGDLKGEPTQWFAIMRGNQDAQTGYGDTITMAFDYGMATMKDASPSSYTLNPGYVQVISYSEEQKDIWIAGVSQPDEGDSAVGWFNTQPYDFIYAYEPPINPVVDTSDANVKADKMLAGYSGYAKGRKVDGSIQLQSKTVTENGIVDPDPGHLLYTVAVNVPVSGSVIKTGTTTSGTIATGLSDVEQFFMYKENLTATGLIHLHYTKEATSRMYASAWSTNNYGTKTITNGTGGVTVSGGTVTISATQAAQGALSSGVTYKWIAVGTE